MEDALFRGNREPTLDEILAEPIVQSIMKRDGGNETTIRALMRRAADRGKPPKLQFIAPSPPGDGDSPPQASAGVLAQAAAAPRWPRVFPSL